jgi:hypothetical protein
MHLSPHRPDPRRPRPPRFVPLPDPEAPAGILIRDGATGRVLARVAPQATEAETEAAAVALGLERLDGPDPPDAAAIEDAVLGLAGLRAPPAPPAASRMDRVLALTGRGLAIRAALGALLPRIPP